MRVHNLLIVLIFLFGVFSFSWADSKRGAFIGAKDTAMPPWFLNSFLDLGEDIDELSDRNKRLIVFIHQPNCPYCHRFITKNFEDKTILKKIRSSFEVVDINMIGDREVTGIDGEVYSEKEFARKYNVQFTPTIIFYDKEKNQVLRLNGYVNIEKFNVALDYVINKQYKQKSYKDYFVEALNMKTQHSLITEQDIFTKSNNFMRKNKNQEFAIFFESSNCPDCIALHNKPLKNEITRDLLKKIDVYQVDLDSSNSIVTPNKMIVKIKDWAKGLNIKNAPTVIFFDNKGKEIIRVEGMLKTFHFQSIVDYVVSGIYKNEKEFQRYLTQRADKIRDKGIDINIWE